MGSKTRTVNNPTVLTEQGQEQFDFAAEQLQGRFGQDPARASFNAGGINSSIGRLNNFSASGSTNAALNRLSNFQGTAAARSSLNQLGNFRGSDDAFRTLSSLEQFGQAERADVKQAPNTPNTCLLYTSDAADE